MRRIDRLIPLVGEPVTVTTTRPVPNELHNWDLVAPAMLFSATSCLVSLRWLAEAPTPRREEDAIVLLRRLYEHVVLFAWIGMDPEVNACKWVAEDFKHRLIVDAELAAIGVRGLTQAARDEFRAFIDKHKTAPDLPTQADHADRYWTKRIAGHGTYPRQNEKGTTGRWSLRKMYTGIYRSASAHAHPTAFSVRDFVWPGATPNTFVIGNNREHPIDRYAYTLAPLLFSIMLLIGEQVLGRPSGDDVRAAIELRT